MPASKAEQVLNALKALLETVLGATIERNSVLPEKIPGGALSSCATAIRANPSRRSAALAMLTISMRSRSRSTLRRAIGRPVTPPSTTCSSRSAAPLTLTRRSAASPSA
jgi:hypothetical protein